MSIPICKQDVIIKFVWLPTCDRTSFVCNLVHLSNLKGCLFCFKLRGNNEQDFFRETHLFFFLKKTNFERFEKFYYFSRVVRKICYNFMKKNWHAHSWTTDVGSLYAPMYASMYGSRCTRRTRADVRADEQPMYASSIGKHRIKKRTYLRGRFCFPYFQYGAK